MLGRPALFIGALVVLCACGADSPGSAVGLSDVAAASSDVGGDVGGGGAGADVAVSLDSSLDTLATDCPGGFGCPCEANGDCDAGLCILTTAGKVCSQSCVEKCPGGMTCVLKSGGDAESFCMPRWGLLCLPCSADLDCAHPATANAACVRYGDEGGFCGFLCKSNADCPSDNACLEVPRVEGGTVKQCVAQDALVDGVPGKSPACACGKHAVAEQLSTTCWVPEKTASGEVVGRCNGLRKCGVAGLLPCAAITGDAKTCIETQCDGPDGQPIPDGKACDDGNGCTSGDLCEKGKCAPGKWVCECKTTADCQDDGDVCNGLPYCDVALEKPVCKVNPASLITCDTAADTACSKTVCVKQTGKCALDFSSPTTLCEDGKPCTKNDHCDGKGACIAGDNLCPCTSTADCPDDGDPCNGTPFCDKSDPDATKWQCKANPASVVVCSASNDTSCSKNQCLPATGKCAMTVIPDGELCDDGDKCSIGTTCKGGKCGAGLATCPCKDSADCVDKDDGDKCNGVMYCDQASGQCKPNAATVVSCPQKFTNACVTDACDPKTGACVQKPLNVGAACDDGVACTTGDACGPKDGGFQCVPGTNTCTCKQDADCAKHQDNACIPLFCNIQLGKCAANLGATVKCKTVDDGPCERTSCDKKTGKCAKKPLADNTVCEDGNPCTPNSACQAGTCAPGPNTCYCKDDSSCAPFDDGNLCNGTMFCDKSKGTCYDKPNSAVLCPADQDTACVANTCQHTFDSNNKPTGTKCAMVAKPDGHKCKDGAPCAAWTCQQGKCQVFLGPCDDKNPCTNDKCDPAKGCAHAPNTAACDDGDKCTGPDTCTGGKCAGPKMAEVCGGGDEDCDGATDEEGAVGCKWWYWDGDNDGHGLSTNRKCLCTAGGTYKRTSGGDCHDGNAQVNPGQGGWFTTPYNKVSGGTSWDYNCNGKTEKYFTDNKSECTGSGIYCKTNRGWKNGTSVPACGASGTYLNACSKSCQAQFITQQQKCH